MRLKVRHTTRYRYEDPQAYGLQELRLTPKSGPGQKVLSWRLSVEGGAEEARFEDQHGNAATLISFASPVRDIAVTAEGEVETADLSGVWGRHQGFAPLWLFRRETALTRAGALVRKLAKSVPEGEPLPRLHDLSRRIREAVAYRIGPTGPDTAAEAALEAGAGVCQDHAQIFLAAARALGFPARYVSGYLLIEGRPEQEAAHAWAEAHVEGLGWVGFDVSNGISPDARYIRAASGLDYREAAPVSGLRFGGGGIESLAVTIEVQQ